MAARILPPPVIENRSDERQVFALLNALRAGFIAITGGGANGLALFSTAIGRGDVLKTQTNGVEVVGLPFQLPKVYPAFTINFSGEIADSGSAGFFRIRAGGTYGNTDGVVIATMNASAPGFAYAMASVSVTSNTATLIQMTLQSTVGHTAQFREGFIIGN